MAHGGHRKGAGRRKKFINDDGKRKIVRLNEK